MTDIFISYSRKDVAMVSKLARTLEASGYSVWWDMSGLFGGQAFDEVIQHQLSTAKCAIVVWSPDSVRSKWVRSEASFADDRGILLTTIYREALVPIPFNTRHNESLLGWDGSENDADFQRLLRSISRLCPLPSAKSKPAGAKLDETVIPDVDTASTPIDTGPSGLVKKIGGGVAALAIVAAGYFLFPKDLLTDQPNDIATQAEVVQPTSTSSPIVVPGEQLNIKKDVAVQDSSAPTTSQANKQTVEKFSAVTNSLLVSAKMALDDNRLTTPENNSVSYYVNNVLKGHPDNTEALKLVSEAASRYQSWVGLNLSNDQLDKATSYLGSSEQLIKSFSLSELESKQRELSFALELAVSKKAKEEAEAQKKAAAEKAALEVEKAKQAANSKVYKLPNKLTLLPIPAGEFMMGSDSEADNEKPAHKVTFAKPFWMSKTEITFDQYDAYAKAAGKNLPNDRDWGRGLRPVIYVSWNDAQGYVKWLSSNNNQGLQCRLPSEAEWEYAARAGSTTQYSWGDSIGKNKANCRECGSQWDFEKTAPVGAFAENAWGLHDMHGNVWEWVQDPWHANYQGAPDNGEVWEKDGDASRRVLRGGSWAFSPYLLRSAFRSRLTPGSRSYFTGFRVVCSPPSVR